MGFARASGVIGIVCALIACNVLSGADSLVAEQKAGNENENENEPASASSSSSGSSASSSGSASSGSSSAGTSGTTSSTTSTTTSSTTSSSGSNDAGGTPSSNGFILNETFATADGCTKGATTNAGIATHDGLGGCMLCATKDGDTLYSLSSTLSTNKAITMDASVRRLNGNTPTTAIIQLSIGGASISGAPGLTTTYARLTTGSASSSIGSSIMATVGIKGGVPGDCIVMDDLRVPLK